MLNAISPLGQAICIVGLAYGAALSTFSLERLTRMLSSVLRAMVIAGTTFTESLEAARAVESRFGKGSAAAVREAERIMFRTRG